MTTAVGVEAPAGRNTLFDHPRGLWILAGTEFWVDPKNQLIGVWMMQVFPPDFGLGTEFKKLVYEALAAKK